MAKDNHSQYEKLRREETKKIISGLDKIDCLNGNYSNSVVDRLKNWIKKVKWLSKV